MPTATADALPGIPARSAATAPFSAAVDTGHLRIDEGTPHAEDPKGAVLAARWQLQLISDTARKLELGIAEAQRLMFGMSS